MSRETEIILHPVSAVRAAEQGEDQRGSRQQAPLQHGLQLQGELKAEWKKWGEIMKAGKILVNSLFKLKLIGHGPFNGCDGCRVRQEGARALLCWQVCRCSSMLQIMQWQCFDNIWTIFWQYFDNILTISDGERTSGNCFSVGSGSIFAYGVLDAGYRWRMFLNNGF